jgi:hypothetical protein
MWEPAQKCKMTSHVSEDEILSVLGALQQIHWEIFDMLYGSHEATWTSFHIFIASIWNFLEYSSLWIDYKKII